MKNYSSHIGLYDDIEADLGLWERENEMWLEDACEEELNLHYVTLQGLMSLPWAVSFHLIMKFLKDTDWILDKNTADHTWFAMCETLKRYKKRIDEIDDKVNK